MRSNGRAFHPIRLWITWGVLSQRVGSTVSVEAAVSAAILQYTHATRVPLQQDAQAVRLPLQRSSSEP